MARPLTDDELKIISELNISIRNKTIFTIGIHTGFRLNEIRCLQIKDLYSLELKEVLKCITVQKQNMKGKKASRSVIISNYLREVLKEYINTLKDKDNKDTYLFVNKNNVPLSKVQIWRIIKSIFVKAKIYDSKGKLGVHTLRKTFAKFFSDKTEGNIYKLQKALGHSNINSTTHYMSNIDKERDDIITGMFDKIYEKQLELEEQLCFT
jgi:site-specific recombinase XerD